MRLWGGESGRIIKRQKDRFYFVMMVLQMYPCQDLSNYTFEIRAMNCLSYTSTKQVLCQYVLYFLTIRKFLFYQRT